MKKVHLLTIDPQIDFCDPGGALYVPGADEDMKRLARFVERHQRHLDDLHVTLDSHRTFHVAHPLAWCDERGSSPAPFTVITRAEVSTGKWRASHPALQKRWETYLERLEVHGRYVLCVWPPHCLIGSPGYAVYPPLFAALRAWEQATIGACVDFVTKGSNPFTEHYSAVMADVPDDTDPGTQLNLGLIQTLQEADLILLAGEALSHCLANTVTDIAHHFGEENIRKLVLLRDSTSSVPGFEALGEQFLQEMTARGMAVSTTQDVL